MGFIDEDVIDPKFVENKSVILLVLGEEVFQAFCSGGILLLDGFDEIAVGSLRTRMFAK